MAPVADTGTADDRGGESPARASAGRWPRDDRGPPAAGWPKLTRRSLAALHPRGRPPSSRTTPCPKVPHPADRHPSEVLPPGILLPTDPGDPGATGCRQQSGVRPKYGTGRWVNWQAGKQIPGVLNSAHLATHSKLEATYARLSRSSPKRPLGRINPQTTKGAPRACGGGPVLHDLFPGSAECSPRVRGWSPAARTGHRCRVVLPARAGVVPSSRTAGPGPRCAPRACGGGPLAKTLAQSWGKCSPHVRGWSRCVARLPSGLRVLPAHVGVGLPIPMRCRGESNGLGRG